MDNHSEKIEQKRLRYAALAEKLRAQAATLNANASDVIRVIGGQPILIGHHSERRHRRDIDRVHRLHRAASAAHKRAEHYAKKAKDYGSHGISSDNPRAAQLIQQKIELLSKLADNKNILGLVLERNYEELRALGVPDRDMRYLTWGTPEKRRVSGVRASWRTEIRRLRDRLAALEKIKNAPPVELLTASGVQISESVDDNRILIVLPGKPDEETRKELKRRAFKWSPTRGAWVRQLTPAARRAAEELAELV